MRSITQCMPLDHQKLIVYQHALELVDVIDRVIAQLPPGSSRLKDQLDRACTSIVANIAEGAGEFAPTEKKRFLRIARRSVNEVVAWIDILLRRKHVSDELAKSVDKLATSIVSMLVTLVR
jgi:four helix bundle protein